MYTQLFFTNVYRHDGKDTLEYFIHHKRIFQITYVHLTLFRKLIQYTGCISLYTVYKFKKKKFRPIPGSTFVSVLPPNLV